MKDLQENCRNIIAHAESLRRLIQSQHNSVYNPHLYAGQMEHLDKIKRLAHATDLQLEADQLK